MTLVDVQLYDKKFCSYKVCPHANRPWSNDDRALPFEVYENVVRPETPDGTVTVGGVVITGQQLGVYPDPPPGVI